MNWNFIKISGIFWVVISLSILGIMFLGLIIHEAVHIAQGKGRAECVCWDEGLYVNTETMEGYLNAHTTFDYEEWATVHEFVTWQQYTEKWAYFIEERGSIIIAFFSGMIIWEGFTWTIKKL